MALHYIIDGYNVIKRSARWADLPLDQGRERFLQYLEVNRPQGSRNNRVTVVFDGQPGLWRPVEDRPARVVFSFGRSADDEIKAMVDHARLRKAIVVVTDDRAIRYYVRACGAAVLGVKEFLAAGEPRTVAGTATGGGPAVKHIPAVMENRINDELRGVWLKKKKGRDAGQDI